MLDLATDTPPIAGLSAGHTAAGVIHFRATTDGSTDTFQAAADAMRDFSRGQAARDGLKAGLYQILLVKVDDEPVASRPFIRDPDRMTAEQAAESGRYVQV